MRRRREILAVTSGDASMNPADHYRMFARYNAWANGFD